MKTKVRDLDRRGCVMREQILEVVQEYPGASLQFIAGRVGRCHALIAYHTAILERQNRLRQEREGRCLQNYPIVPSCDPRWEPLLPILRDRKRRALVELLTRDSRREWNGHQLSVHGGVSYTMLLSTMKSLRQHGFVSMDRLGTGRYKIKATPLLLEGFDQNG